MGASISHGIAAFALYAFAVPVLLRLVPQREPAAIVLANAAVMWVVALAGLLALGQRVDFWAYSTSYGFLVLCFLMVFGAIYKSVSLRLLAQLATRSSADAGAIARELLERSYEERLAIIVAKGYAERREERFVLTPSGRGVAATASGLQRIFGITRSG